MDKIILKIYQQMPGTGAWVEDVGERIARPGKRLSRDRGQVSLGSGLNPQLVSHPAPRNIRSLIIPYPVCGVMITLWNNISRDICCKLLCCGIIPLNNFFRADMTKSRRCYQLLKFNC